MDLRDDPVSAASRALPVAAVVAAASLWGTTGTAQDLGPDSSTALGVGALRLALGGLTLVLLAVAQKGLRFQPWRSAWRPLVAGGAFVALYQLSFFEATRRAGVAPATVITIASAPVVSTLIGVLRRTTHPSRGALVSLGTTILGVTLLGLAAGAADAADSPAVGVICALAAGAGYAGYAELGRIGIDRGMHSTTAMAALFCVGAALACTTLPWQPLAWVGTGSGALLLAHLAVVTLGVGYALYGWGLGRLPVPTVVTLTLAEPVVAAILAVAVLDQALAPTGWLGILLVVLGLAAAGRDAARSRGATTRAGSGDEEHGGAPLPSAT